tara:strand:- start:658 stop:1365 length:708 start_codon:yes stop_codon:yes gene_type:complete
MSAQDAVLTGSIKANSGEIATWNILEDRLYNDDAIMSAFSIYGEERSVHTYGKIVDTGFAGLGVIEASFGQTRRSHAAPYWTGKTGIDIGLNNGSSYFPLITVNEDGASMAGWSFDTTKIYKDNMEIDGANQRILVKDDLYRTMVTLGKGDLSDVVGTALNTLRDSYGNSGFEYQNNGAPALWYSASIKTIGDTQFNITGSDTLWGGGTIYFNVTGSDPAAGSNHFEIAVNAEVF